MKLIYSNFEYGLRSPQKRIITIIKDMDLGPFSLKSLTAKGWFAACSNIWATSLCCLSKFIVLLKSLTLYDEREREPIFWSINMGILGIYIYIYACIGKGELRKKGKGVGRFLSQERWYWLRTFYMASSQPVPSSCDTKLYNFFAPPNPHNYLRYANYIYVPSVVMVRS